MTKDANSIWGAIPFYLVFLNIPLLVWVANTGGWSIPIAWVFFILITFLGDSISGPNFENMDPQTRDNQLFWYNMVTNVWPIAQVFLIFYAIHSIAHSDFNIFERAGIMTLIGLSSGVAGIVIAHELIHQKNRLERFLGDLLLSTVMYGYFRTEHLLVHHRYVATPRDAVTARYNESIYRFLLRAIPHEFVSAWRTEAEQRRKMGKKTWHRSNPFYLYFTLTLIMLLIAFALGGWHGVLQFWVQAVTAIVLLETTNYIEHYGLVRLHLGDGKYEHVQPRHSWNANHRFTNYLMINLQRHSDHHYKPQRRFPLLQALDETDAPQLPYGYVVMALYAYSPYHWRKLMNHRVRRWRSMYYPAITDWREYNNASTPMPK